MSKLRVHELAKKLGVDNKEIVKALSDLGVKGKTHSSTIEDEAAEKIEKLLKKKTAPQVKPRKTTAKPEKKKPAEEKKAEEKKTKPAKAARPVKKPVEPGLAAKTEPVAEVKKPVQPVVHPEKIKEPVKAIEEKKQPKEIKFPEEKPLPVEEALPAETAVPLPEEEVVQKVPDRFKKELETEKDEKKSPPNLLTDFLNSLVFELSKDVKKNSHPLKIVLEKISDFSEFNLNHRLHLECLAEELNG